MLLAKMTSRQLAEWIAYYRMEPWGEDRADLRSGIVASTMANINRKKGASPFKPEDFMPRFDKKKETVPDTQKIREAMTRLVAIQNRKKT